MERTREGGRGQDRSRKEARWQFAVPAPTTSTGATNSHLSFIFHPHFSHFSSSIPALTFPSCLSPPILICISFSSRWQHLLVPTDQKSARHRARKLSCVSKVHFTKNNVIKGGCILISVLCEPSNRYSTNMNLTKSRCVLTFVLYVHNGTSLHVNQVDTGSFFCICRVNYECRGT